MLEAIVGIGAVVLLLILGFWWTRGAGGVPGGVDDPAQQELRSHDALGDRVADPGTDPASASTKSSE